MRLWALLALWLCARHVSGQETISPELLSSYEGQTVSQVELAGRPDLAGPALEQLQSLVMQKPGQPFEFALINQSIHSLKALKQFEDVRLEIRPEEEGLRVILLLEPAYYIGQYTFPGADRNFFSYSRLLQVSNYTPQEPFSSIDTRNAEAALTEHFRRTGFFQAEVKASVLDDPAHLLAGVQFNTQLKQRARFGNVTITGVNPQEAARLQHSITTLRARLRSSAVRPGRTSTRRPVSASMSTVAQLRPRRSATSSTPSTRGTATAGGGIATRARRAACRETGMPST